MLGRFCKIEDTVIIPQSNNQLLMSDDGTITSVLTGQVVNPQQSLIGEKFLYVETVEGSQPIKVAVMLACITKKLKIPVSLWHRLDVHYLDSDVRNISPENLIWKFPSEGIHPNPRSEFRYIPGFSRYSINKDGVLYSHVSNQILSPYSDKLGYLMYGLTPDVGKRTIVGMHRALALAFLPYPPNVDSLDVNHLDGVKSNNKLDNLEWAARKRNCDHAYSTGLRTDNIAVDVRDSFTGEVFSFYSLEECARQLGCDGETIRLRVRSRGDVVYLPGFQFKLSSDTSEWKLVEDPLKEMRRSGVAKPMTAVNKESGQVHHLKSTTELGKLLGISSSGASLRVRNLETTLDINGFQVSLFYK